MERHERGDIVLVPFPFLTPEGRAKRKLRPALVISPPTGRRYPDLSLMAITSRIPNDPSATDVVLTSSDRDFEPTGLKVSSTFRAEAVMTIPTGLIHGVIGHVSPDLLRRIEGALATAFGFEPRQNSSPEL